ncbi:hypothetical protein CBR_g23302 [Chara braunii]|uniref:Uncharacterized protein n=1 Tax=Chara braunii TaxID=69332 RepID=A0A388L3T8_CHABU|nr:hypothetical protein CBR_g23302 [Chara braunii]|eukprot:GBG76971.1 hypothetical protein CBR_g23302 [Chara braunii]
MLRYRLQEWRAHAATLTSVVSRARIISGDEEDALEPFAAIALCYGMLKVHPMEKGEEDPELGFVRFDMDVSVKARVKPRLVVGVPRQGDYYFEVVSAQTPWCNRCREFYHEEKDDCCPGNAEADPFADNFNRPVPPSPPFSGFVPIGEKPPTTGFRRFPGGNQSYQEKLTSGSRKGSRDEGEKKTKGLSKGKEGKPQQQTTQKKKGKSKQGDPSGQHSRVKGDRSSRADDGVESESEGNSRLSALEKGAYKALSKAFKSGSGGRDHMKDISFQGFAKEVKISEGSEEEKEEEDEEEENEKECGGYLMEEEGSGTGGGGRVEGLVGGVPIETLNRGDDIVRVLVPLIFARASSGVMILATQLADGSMEQPTVEFKELLTQPAILKRTRYIVPSCLQIRVIQGMRTGVHTVALPSGQKTRFYFVFLDAKMENTIKDQLEALDRSWFALNLLDSDLNEDLEKISLKGSLSAKVIAEWLRDAEVYRSALFDESFKATLGTPWQVTSPSSGGREGARRRKKPDNGESPRGRIHGKKGLSLTDAQ